MKTITAFILPLAICILSVIAPSHAEVMAHYSFDADLKDSSGNGRHGSLIDMGTSGNTTITTTPGTFKFGGGAMDFSDERDYVSVPFISFSSGEAYTISFWAQVDDASRVWNMVIGEESATSDNHFIGLNGETDSLRWRGFSQYHTRQAEFATGVNDSLWHHYVVVARGQKILTEILVYLDGKLVSSVSEKKAHLKLNAIGAAFAIADHYDFRGRIDEVWIFNEAIGAATVKSLFTHNSTTAAPKNSGALISLGGITVILDRGN